MKQLTGIGITLVLLAALAGCGGGGANVSDTDAKEAFAYSFASAFMTSMGLAFGQEVPGATLDQETNELTLDGFDLNAFVDDPDASPYSSASGTISNEEGRMIVNLTLAGGPVETIEFSIGEEEMQAAEGFTIDVRINGVDMELEVTEDDLG